MISLLYGDGQKFNGIVEEKKSSIQVDDNGTRFAVQLLWFFYWIKWSKLEWCGNVDNWNSKMLHRHKLSYQIGTILTPDTLVSCFRICENAKCNKQTNVKIGREEERKVGKNGEWKIETSIQNHWQIDTRPICSLSSSNQLLTRKKALNFIANDLNQYCCCYCFSVCCCCWCYELALVVFFKYWKKTHTHLDSKRENDCWMKRSVYLCAYLYGFFLKFFE